MKKSVLIGILVFSLAALLAVGTWAWFTAEAEPVVNQFTTGTVEIEINEHGFKDIDNWNPGDTTDKEVSVISNGSKATYVRVALTPVWGEIVEGEFVANNELSIDNVTLNWNEEDWVYSDGWYYYKSILPAGDETSLLLESVTLTGGLTGNEYQGKTLQIDIKAEAVQASYDDAYKDAWGLDSLPWESSPQL